MPVRLKQKRLCLMANANSDSKVPHFVVVFGQISERENATEVTSERKPSEEPLDEEPVETTDLKKMDCSKQCFSETMRLPLWVP